jgi:predicted membrane protein
MKMNFLFSNAFWGVLLILWGLSLVLKAFFPSIRFPIATIFISICIIVFGFQLLIGGFGSNRSRNHKRMSHGYTERISEEFSEELNVVFSTDSIRLNKLDVSTQDRYVDVNAVFGRAIIYVSSTTPVRIEADAVFGKIYKDSRLKWASGNETALIINADAVFGSVDIIVLD